MVTVLSEMEILGIEITKTWLITKKKMELSSPKRCNQTNRMSVKRCVYKLHRQVHFGY